MTPTVLITRPQDDARRLERDLQAMVPRIHIVIAPVMEICPQAHERPTGRFDMLLLTSRHAVPAAATLIGVPSYCVGAATAEAARAQGHEVRAVFETADALVLDLRKHKGGRAVHLHGRHTRGQVAKRLNSAGLETKSIVVYDQIMRAWSEAERRDVFDQDHLIVPLYSPRTADLVGKNLAGFKGDVTLIGLSQACLSAWSGPNPVAASCVEYPDGDVMKRAIASHVSGSPLEGGGHSV